MRRLVPLILLAACSSGEPQTPPAQHCSRLLPLGAWTAGASGVAMLYRAETCKGERLELTAADAYELTESGAPVEGLSVSLSEGQRVYVSLLLERGPAMLEGARELADALVAGSAKTFVGIRSFDGGEEPHTVLAPTRDVDALHAALGRLAGPAPGGTVNLRGAVGKAVTELRAFQEAVRTRNGLGVVTSGFVVVLSAGADTAGLSSREDARRAIAAARLTEGLNAPPNVRTYALSLGGPELPQLVAEVGDHLAATPETLVARAKELAGRVAAEANATHLLRYCSTARSGSREVRLRVSPGALERDPASRSLLFSFSADGFGDGCFETCDQRACGAFGCGACDDGSELCDSGRCVDECVSKDLCGGEPLVNELGHARTCGGGGVQRCGGSCVDTGSDDRHCGGCGVACETAFGERCVEGHCRCEGGGEVCAGACQPPAYFEANDAHCGTCGRACTGGASCVEGECRCPGESDLFCAGACRDADSDPNHCGACGTRCTVPGEVCLEGECACPGGGSVCRGACQLPSHFLESEYDCGTCNNGCTVPGSQCLGGTCGCPAGQGECDGACVSLSTTSNCGTCGAACTATNAVCTEAGCACPQGQAVCDGACVSMSSTLNCGACGEKCAVGGSCTPEGCACPEGQGVCNGSCISLRTVSNCGACGNACATGASCVEGSCRCPEGQTPCNGACVDTKTSLAHCGTCGNACTVSGSSCDQGTCRCPPDQVDCDGTCRATKTDVSHCGGCGTECSLTLVNAICAGGSCTCADGLEICSGACVDLDTNTQHCGGCGRVCTQPGSFCIEGNCQCHSTQTVCNGACVNTTQHDDHCGACNVKCATGRECQGGKCLEVVGWAGANPGHLVVDGTHLYAAVGNGKLVKLPKSGGALVELASTANVDDLVLGGGSLFWTERLTGIVGRVPLSGGQAGSFATGQTRVRSLALDATTLYWTREQGEVMKKPLASTAAPVKISQSSYRPGSIVVDATNAYWVESDSGGGVMKAPLGGGTAVRLASMNGPRPTSLLLSGGFLYVASQDPDTFYGPNGRIARVSASGGTLTPLASGETAPGSLATDGTSLYWVSQNTASASAIRRMPLAGGAVTTLASGLYATRDLALDGTHVYFSSGYALYRVPK